MEGASPGMRSDRESSGGRMVVRCLPPKDQVLMELLVRFISF